MLIHSLVFFPVMLFEKFLVDFFDLFTNISEVSNSFVLAFDKVGQDIVGGLNCITSEEFSYASCALLFEQSLYDPSIEVFFYPIKVLQRLACFVLSKLQTFVKLDIGFSLYHPNFVLVIIQGLKFPQITVTELGFVTFDCHTAFQHLSLFQLC